MVDIFTGFQYNIIGNILETENQKAIINDVIEVKTGVYLHKN